MQRKNSILFLDMDGTLLDLHFDNYFWLTYLPDAYAVSKNIERKQAMQFLEPYFTDLRGTLNWYCTDYWSSITGLDIIALKAQIHHKIQFLPNVYESLPALKKQYSACIIITNAHPDSVELKQQRTGICSMVDELISAHEFGAPKESQVFWQALQKRLQFNPHNAYFVDDNLQVLNAAYEFGINDLFHITYPDTTQKIQERASAEHMVTSISGVHELLSFISNS